MRRAYIETWPRRSISATHTHAEKGEISIDCILNGLFLSYELISNKGFTIQKKINMVRKGTEHNEENKKEIPQETDNNEQILPKE